MISLLNRMYSFCGWAWDLGTMEDSIDSYDLGSMTILVLWRMLLLGILAVLASLLI